MNNEDKDVQGILQGMFAGADFNGAQIIAYNNGEVIYNKYSDEKPKQTLSEERIVSAIKEIITYTDENGAPLFTDKAQWYAIYRVLNVYAGYPSQMTQFERKMNDMGFDKDSMLTYDSLKKASVPIPQLTSVKPETWDAFKDKSEQYEKQYRVAEMLMIKLGI